MKILITGGSGLLGKSLLETEPVGVDISATYHKNQSGDLYKLDVSNADQVNELFDTLRPDVVIHTAAIGSVDYAASHYDEAREVNCVGTKHIVQAANGHRAKMVYISSNAVYSGNEPPYNEGMPAIPVNSYGRLKSYSERYVMNYAKSWLVIRPFLLYGWPPPGGRGNWASSIVVQLKRGKGFKMVDDHIWMPTYAPDCAKAIWQLLIYDHEIFNVAAPERATLYQFGLQICDVFDLDRRLIEPVSSAYFDSIATRPQDTTYDLAKLNRFGIMLSDLKTGLEKMRAAGLGQARKSRE